MKPSYEVLSFFKYYHGARQKAMQEFAIFGQDFLLTFLT
jgi:hypothetical protein